jgi:hypothetical protein
MGPAFVSLYPTDRSANIGDFHSSPLRLVPITGSVRATVSTESLRYDHPGKSGNSHEYASGSRKLFQDARLAVFAIAHAGMIGLLIAASSLCLFSALLDATAHHPAFMTTARLIAKCLFAMDMISSLIGLCGLIWDKKRGLSALSLVASLWAAGFIGMYVSAI